MSAQVASKPPSLLQVHGSKTSFGFWTDLATDFNVSNAYITTHTTISATIFNMTQCGGNSESLQMAFDKLYEDIRGWYILTGKGRINWMGEWARMSMGSRE